ncbi:MAG: glycosyltransferase family 2 protein [Flavobacteriales bacterium]|nr:glycosyltransferase family 2 protein [Flavobacteriales bacterium]MCB9447765.1 glycosyltransferase family 2 protein [Flavobacteriales bacterium]
MTNQQLLTAVIPTFNRKRELSQLLGQLKAQQQPDVRFNMVVVVDGSTDGTLEMLRDEYPEVHVVSGDGNWWFTRSINEGCRYAVEQLKSDIILTLNDDVQLPDHYLRDITKSYFDAGANVIMGSASFSVSTPRLITFSGFKSQNRLLLKYHKYVPPFTYMEPGELTGYVPSITLPTRGVVMPADVLKRLNYFDDKTFPQYNSDYDFVLRAARKGVKVFVSYDAYVLENMQLTSGGNPRLVKSFGAYLRNIFKNRYSSNYFFNQLNMSWRFGYKLLFPFYFFVAVAVIPYVYIKYKHSSLNKVVDGKN